MVQCLPLLLLLTTCCYLVSASAKHDGGMSGKFRNLSTKRAKLYWVNFEGKGQMNAVLAGDGGLLSFQTYVGHNFFWGEYDDEGKTPVPVTRKGVKNAAFTIREDQLIYALIDDSASPELLKDHNKEVDFLKTYKKRTGRDWLANYPRDPPILPMRKCTVIGATLTVPITEEARKTLCGDGTDACRSTESSIELQCVSVKPCAWAMTNFLSDFEADFIMEKASPQMQRSGLMGGAEQMQDSQRTSMSYRMQRKSSKIVDIIYRRAGQVLDIPHQVLTNERNAEPLDVLRYLNGQQYQPHFDWYVTGVPETRFVSFLMYLNTPPKGGSTRFPNGVAADGSEGISIRAVKKRAFFFYNMLEDGNVDDYSLHEGTPVQIGPKWLSTIWVWDPKQSDKPASKSDVAKELKGEIEEYHLERAKILAAEEETEEEMVMPPALPKEHEL